MVASSAILLPKHVPMTCQELTAPGTVSPPVAGATVRLRLLAGGLLVVCDLSSANFESRPFFISSLSESQVSAV